MCVCVCVCVCVGSIFFGNFSSGCLCSIYEIEMSTWHMSRADYRVYEKLLEKKIKMLCSCGNSVVRAVLFHSGGTHYLS